MPEAIVERYLSARTAVEAAVAAVLAGALSLVVFGPILGRLGSPLGPGDMLATYVNADNWSGFGYGASTHYGFPAGMNLNYSPNIDITENGFAKLVNLLSGSPFLGINLMLLLSFPAVAGLAYLALRMVSRGGPVAVALAVAYSLIPYHFGRGLGHTYLATMVAGVTGVMLALVIGMGWLPSLLRHGTRGRRVVMIVLVAALVVVTAWSGLYYAAFGTILMTTAVVWRIAKRDAWGSVALGLVPLAATALIAVLGFVPGFLTVLQDPPLAALNERSVGESVTLAGNLAMALTPAPISQMPGMSRYNGFVNDSLAAGVAGTDPVESIALTNYGTWITTACLLLAVVGLIVLARRRRLRGSALPLIACLGTVTVAFFVPWGLNFVTAVLVTPQVRAWNRLLPVLLLLFVLGAMAALARTRADSLTPWSIAAAIVILAVVWVDQAKPFGPAYRQGAERGEQIVALADELATKVNAVIPEHCGVLQLPYAQYPEQGTIAPSLNDYEHFVHPLANTRKDFSYGAVKNTEASRFAASLGRIPTSTDLDALRAAGFCAIEVDRRGIPDSEWGFMQVDLTRQLGEPIARGNDDLWQVFDLRRTADD